MTTSAVRPRTSLHAGIDADTDSDHHERDQQSAQLLEQAAASTCPVTRQRLQNEVILLNRGLALAIAHRYRYRGVEDQDLEQVALLALVKAVRRFRPDAGSGLAAFASPTIAGEVKRYFRDHAWGVRPPRAVQQLTLSLAASRAMLTQALGHEPTSAELANELGVDERDVRSSIQAAQGFTPVSLDAPGSGGTAPRVDRIASAGDDMAHVDNLTTLQAAIDDLPGRDRRMLHLRFVQESPQHEIAALLGISQMTVSRRLSRVLTKLRLRLQDATDCTGTDRASA